jgi:uncharacterized protein YcbX
MEAGAVSYYEAQSARLRQAGLAEDRYFEVVEENARRVNLAIIEALIAMGCKLEHLRPENCGHDGTDSACESCSVADCPVKALAAKLPSR